MGELLVHPVVHGLVVAAAIVGHPVLVLTGKDVCPGAWIDVALLQNLSSFVGERVGAEV